MTEYVESVCETADWDLDRVRKELASGCYNQMVLGSADIMKSLVELTRLTVDAVRIIDRHAANAKVRQAAEDFKARYGEFFNR